MTNFRITRSTLIGIVIVAVATAGCTWVQVSEEGEGVKILDQKEVEGCEQIGKTRSQTTTKVLFFHRNKNTVLEEQTGLARNEAARMGGNAVSALGEPEGEARLFGIYKCPAK